MTPFARGEPLDQISAVPDNPTSHVEFWAAALSRAFACPTQKPARADPNRIEA